MQAPMHLYNQSIKKHNTMKKTLLAIAVCALAASFSSCSKSDSNDTLPTNYKIDGVQDVTVQSTVNPTGYMQLTVSYTGKVQERVDLSLEGAPAGCGGEVSVTGGYPTFSSAIVFSDTSATPGTYPMKLICVGSKTGKKSYDFNLIVKPEPDYGSVFLGTYNNTINGCAGTSNVFTTTVTAGDKTNKVILNNIDNHGTSIYAMVTNFGQIFNVPAQTVNGITYSGYGSAFSGQTGFSINYTMMLPSGSQSCSVYFNK